MGFIEYLFFITILSVTLLIIRSNSIELNNLKEKYKADALKDERIFRAIRLQRFEN